MDSPKAEGVSLTKIALAICGLVMGFSGMEIVKEWMRPEKKPFLGMTCSSKPSANGPTACMCVRVWDQDRQLHAQECVVQARLRIQNALPGDYAMGTTIRIYEEER